MTKAEPLHERVMRAVALRMPNTPYDLNGGTALAILDGPESHSGYLDIESALPPR